MRVARELAEWAVRLQPTREDLELADAALVDTVAVALAGRAHPAVRAATMLSEPARWAILAHVLDFDDLHLPSTAHISAVCVPAALAVGGGGPEYLVAAGVMARLGAALGWQHYARGWHATTTAGAPAAAAGAAAARRLDADGVATAMALAVPAAGGVQRAFGTDAKSLQVGFAVEAGVRAAALAEAGARADLAAVDQWLSLLSGDAERLSVGGPAVPGGLAVKLYPCCYALQRPIAAARALRDGLIEPIRRVHVRTPESSVRPLIHRLPDTGLQAKFSLHYGLAAALLDERVDFTTFSDAAVQRPALRALAERIEVELESGGDGLLSGTLSLTVDEHRIELRAPPGAPERPLTAAELSEKMARCTRSVNRVNWEDARDLLRAA